MIIENEAELIECLSKPTAADCESLTRLGGDFLVLGAGGKIGPELSRRLKRAVDQAGLESRVIAVSRFTLPGVGEDLARAGVEVIECDLLRRSEYTRLPEAPNVFFLAGRKFGSTERSDLTWAMNAVVPAYAAERFASSRIVVFSTGNVYPFVPASSGGCSETDSVQPVGEYGQSCLARERVFEYFSRERQTRCLFFRLNYAVDLRYGVLVDIARKVRNGEPIELGVASFNVIWQGDVNSYAVRSLELCASPPRILNITGPETLSVRKTAEFFGHRFGRQPIFRGEESDRALLSNASQCHALLGYPEVPVQTLLDWVANWLECGGRTLNKPTHFEVSDGKY
ncbi:MAG: NAD-dependent epimerase/dehydratase family protein [Acidobacteriota bacterium]